MVIASNVTSGGGDAEIKGNYGMSTRYPSIFDTTTRRYTALLTHNISGYLRPPSRPRRPVSTVRTNLDATWSTYVSEEERQNLATTSALHLLRSELCVQTKMHVCARAERERSHVRSQSALGVAVELRAER